ncbi:MAG: PSD1 and planctomycete cytochrome C domain-containing protein [Bryobacteraceae bacterium]
MSLRHLFCASALFTALAAAQQPPDFARDIQPIFVKACSQCHGAKAQMANLRLDDKASAARTIQPRNPAASTLYQRLAGGGDQARMPMGAKPLPQAEIELVRRWIESGAAWPDSSSAAAPSAPLHWAFIPPKRPAIPNGNAVGVARNPIDRFVLARLEKENLKPSPEADRVTLLRRLSLDLTGLPPQPREVDAFLADNQPGAYERQVERLLASPHYGERWGRHWLDAARYADSDGFEKDKQRWVWFYRDWVVDAFNRDLPYDRFIIEQIAGDMLPGATQSSRVATGFLRNSMINEEGGIEPEQFRMEAMFDRIDAIGKSVLGLTIQCAQCHNHKYDPFTHEDYYRIFAFLNNSHESNIAVYTPDEQRRRTEIFKQIRDIEASLTKPTPAQGNTTWTPVEPNVDDISTGGQKYILQSDLSMLAAGYAPTKHKAQFTFKTDLPRITAIRLDLLNDPNLPLGGPGRSPRGTGALTEFEVESTGPGSTKTKHKIARAAADLDLAEEAIPEFARDKDERAGKKTPRVTGPIAYAIDGNDQTAWGHDAGPVLRNQPRAAVFFLETPIENPKEVTVYLSQKHGGWNSDDNQNYNLGRMRISFTADADPRPPAPLQLDSRVAALYRQLPEGSSQLVLNERAQTRKTHILARGDFLKPTREVTPGVPSFLHSLPDGVRPDRLAFARWLADRRSPTTARAFVNRVWQAYFGTGIVATSEDLGRQSEAPSHPELLDWLAVEFMEPTAKGAHPWSVKSLHRLIVNSATYRQSSRVTPQLNEIDPYNRLLARGPRFRVEGEIVRDIALAASGLLNPAIGGPPVYPPAPDFLFQPPASYGPKIWNEEKGDARFRRALYTFRYRSVPYPMLQTFDAPNGDMACVRRSRSNTPLQALTTLNEPLFLEAARALAKRTLEQGGSSDPLRLNFAFRRCVSREPAEAESAELLQLLRSQQRRFQSGELKAVEFAGVDSPDLAAWTAVARVILNLDETITKE